MSKPIRVAVNEASEMQIAAFLQRCDSSFVPPLGGRVDMGAYARKIATHAQRIEAWTEGELAGLVAAYCNAPDRQRAYITSISVLPAHVGKGIGVQLMESCIAHIRAMNFAEIGLEVASDNAAAISLYRKCGFVTTQASSQSTMMTLQLTERT